AAQRPRQPHPDRRRGGVRELLRGRVPRGVAPEGEHAQRAFRGRDAAPRRDADPLQADRGEGGAADRVLREGRGGVRGGGPLRHREVRLPDGRDRPARGGVRRRDRGPRGGGRDGHRARPGRSVRRDRGRPRGRGMMEAAPTPISHRPRRHPRRRRIPRAAFPSTFTLLNLLSGFYAIIMTAQGDFDKAAWLVVAAGLFDAMDGMMARLVDGVSDFGIELDSLSDIVSFGVAPSFLLYEFGLNRLGLLGGVLAALPAICGAVRLARYNVSFSEKKDYF